MFRTPSRHVCLAARPNPIIEHLQAVARQSLAEGLEPCWLDLGHEEGIPEFAASYDDFGAKTVPVHTQAALRRHFKKHRPIGVWVQTPYPEHYPDWFWDTVEEVPLCFAQYSITMMTWEYGLYQMPTIPKFRWILVENRNHGYGYVVNGIPAERVVVAGNPVLYELRHRSESELIISNDLLWTSHWSEEWFGQGGFSRWREVAPVLLKHAREHPERQIVVRPHPLLHERAVEKADTDDEGYRAYQDLLASPNVTLSDRSLADDVAFSGAMLSDGLSILAYFASTGKPLGMVHDEETPDYNELGYAILGCSDELSTAAEIEAWLDRLPELKPDDKRRRVMDKLLPALPESPIAIWNRQRQS